MITVTILTKNSQETLAETLNSIKDFPEVLIYDNGSTDQTLQIASGYVNVKIIQGEFIGFGPTHNLVSSLAQNDWILSLDSDEVLSPELNAEIQQLKLDPKRVYSFQRKNFFNGKWIKVCGGWHPDWVVRLYNRTATHFSHDAVHEKILTADLERIPLNGHANHTPYRQMSDFLSKMQNYSNLFAHQHQNKKKSSLLKAIGHGWFSFLKSYFLKKGFLGGREGFIISIYNGHTAFYKYLKLMEINRKNL